MRAAKTLTRVLGWCPYYSADKRVNKWFVLIGLMACSHCMGPGTGMGPGPGPGPMDLYIMLCTVHTTPRPGTGQGAGMGTDGFHTHF